MSSDITKSASGNRRRLVRYLEVGLLGVGLTLVAIFVAARMHGAISSRAALREFAELNHPVAVPAAVTMRDPVTRRLTDFGLWSDQRITAYKESLSAGFDRPMAVLSIRRLGIEGPVFDGTDDLTLNRGIGRIVGTAKPGEPGNIGLAGHRDGFFRALKDVRVGDEIDLAIPGESLLYVVDGVEIVTPDDVSVLEPRARPALTLVTCYPFYFIGSAPNRFIVHASVSDASSPDRK
jgi:sortase A